MCTHRWPVTHPSLHSAQVPSTLQDADVALGADVGSGLGSSLFTRPWASVYD